MVRSHPGHRCVTREEDTVYAFLHDGPVYLPATSSGPLDGMRLGVKDIFDIAGERTGFGNPTWRATHPPAVGHAAAVASLLAHGAHFVGKTHTDELAFSLTGSNYHYGAPINAAAPDRITGGSSSGSAAAVAAGLCDIGLGTDTAGSVRAPASFCGLFGFRPSHGAISRDGVCALAPSFDTVGWLARDARTLRLVGEALLPSDTGEWSEGRYAWADDLWSLIEPGRGVPPREAAERWSRRGLGERREQDLGAAALDAWFDAFRTLQLADVDRALGPWVRAHQPLLGPGVRERVNMARSVTPQAVAAASAVRDEVRDRLARIFQQATVLVLPTVPGAAPPRGQSPEAMERYRRTAMRLLCVAGLTGCPQVTLPLLTTDGLPLGLSLLSPRGTDRALLQLVDRIA